MPNRASTADRVHSAAIHVLRMVRQHDEEDGITPARLSLLSVLVFSGPTTVKDLAAAEGISSPSATSLINALEAAGLARRARSAGDKRTVEVSVTGAGRSMFRRARARRLAVLTSLLEEASSADAELLARAADILLALRPEHPRPGGAA